MKKENRHRDLLGACMWIAACLVLIGLCLAPQPAYAQNYYYTFGRQPWSAPSPTPMGYVDLANGDLHLEIPIASMPERGNIPFHAALVYDSHIWQQVTSGTTTWQPTNVANSWGGWRLVKTGDVGSISFKLTILSCLGTGGIHWPYNSYSNFVWISPDGRRIPFAITTTDPSGGTCHTSGTGGTGTSADGTGYTMTVTSGTSGTIYAPNGVEVYPRLTDLNGNYYASGTDTLGRSPVATSTVGSTTTYSVLNSEGSGATYQVAVTTQSIPVHSNFSQSGVTDTSTNITVIQSIALPDGSSYSFTYDQGSSSGHYGTLASMTLPTGGVVDYTNSVITDTYSNNYLYLTGGTWNGGTWSFSPVAYTGCGGSPPHCEDVTISKPTGDQDVHSFIFYGGTFFWGATPWDFLQRYYSGSSNLLREVQVSFTAAPNVYPQTITTTVPSTGGNNLVKRTTITYTANNVGTPQEVDETEYGSNSPPAGNARVTSYSYYGGNSNLTNAKETISISGMGASSSRSITYDSLSLGSAAGLTNHDDTNFGTSYVARGNPTVIQTTGFPATTLKYNMVGQVIQSTDALGNTTNFYHDDRFYNDNGANPPSGPISVATTNAYLTEVVLPSPFSWPIYFGYYYGSGKMAWTEDQNVHLTYFHTNWSSEDPWDRTIETQRPIGWSLRNYASATEIDDYLGITDAYASTGCSSCRHDQEKLDDWGRVMSQSLVNDPEGADETAYSLNAMSQIDEITQTPRYGDGAPDESFNYDPLGRRLQNSHADSTSQNTYYGPSVTGAGGIGTQLCSIGSNGYGFPVLSVDEAGHKRESWIDGFGNTIEVDEPDPASGSLTIATCYAYDALGNLTGVTQGTQTRAYTYDGLSRVLTATTPESGTIHYSYMNGSAACSPNPNSACSRTDALGVKTTYSYDALGRLTGKSYSDSTHAVTYTYDSGTGQKGYMTGMTDGSGTTSWTYDANGRKTSEQRTIAGIIKTTSYVWNEDGTVKQIVYPSGRTVQYNTNNAERATSAWDTATPTVFYAYNAIYAVSGALRGVYNNHVASVTNGNHYTENFNNRLQLSGIGVSSAGGTALEYLTINYNAVGNDGTIASITNGVATGLGETFTYDDMDRVLTGATQSSTATGCWGQSFGSSGVPDDRWSNLTQITVTQCTAGMLNVSAPSNNQLSSGTMAYNGAGNMTGDGAGDTFAFDAENHITTASGTMVTGGTWYYTYDGHGVRVAKCDNRSSAPCTGAAGGTLYWRDINGNVLSESDLSGNITNDYIYFAGRKAAQEDASGTIHYLYPDQLNSTVMMTDSGGTTCYNATFTPYGEEHSILNTCSTNYKFTGYERDSETGLDYAFARYYSSRLGRFMSADALAGRMRVPQSLNRYAYVINNPLVLTDPSGNIIANCSYYHNCPSSEEDGGGDWGDLDSLGTGGYGAWGGVGFPADGGADDGDFGGGDGQLTSQDNLDKCLSALFPTVTPTSFSPSQPASLEPPQPAVSGTFTGMIGSSTFTVTNYSNIISTGVIAIGNPGLAVDALINGSVLGGDMLQADPYTTYTGSDLSASQTLGAQILELGNALNQITGQSSLDQAQLDDSTLNSNGTNNAPGRSLYNCVFNGQ